MMMIMMSLGRLNLCFRLVKYKISNKEMKQKDFDFDYIVFLIFLNYILYICQIKNIVLLHNNYVLTLIPFKINFKL